MQPIQYRPRQLEEFIGDARRIVKLIDAVVARSKPQGDPIALFFQGEPGIAKSACAQYAIDRIDAGKWSVTKLNGTQLKIEMLEDFARSLTLKDMFGGYRVLWVEEADKSNHIVAARILTLIDDLPSYSAVIFTSNSEMRDVESRLQSRFQVFKMKPPGEAEIATLLRRWLPEQSAVRIATFACGNVRAALKEAQNELDGGIQVFESVNISTPPPMPKRVAPSLDISSLRAQLAAMAA